MNDDVEILLDLDRLPSHIGTKREFSTGRVFCHDDVADILDWIDKKIGNHYNVDVLLIGKMPNWIALAIQHYLDYNSRVEKVRYSYPNTAIFEVCDKREEVMV